MWPEVAAAAEPIYSYIGFQIFGVGFRNATCNMKRGKHVVLGPNTRETSIDCEGRLQATGHGDGPASRTDASRRL